MTKFYNFVTNKLHF